MENKEPKIKIGGSRKCRWCRKDNKFDGPWCSAQCEEANIVEVMERIIKLQEKSEKGK